jgi:hypothetical protein
MSLTPNKSPVVQAGTQNSQGTTDESTVDETQSNDPTEQFESELDIDLAATDNVMQKLLNATDNGEQVRSPFEETEPELAPLEEGQVRFVLPSYMQTGYSTRSCVQISFPYTTDADDALIDELTEFVKHVGGSVETA